MRHLIVRRTVNSPDMNDAKGAFMPEAKALQRLLEQRGDGVRVRPLLPPDALLDEHSHGRTDTLSVFCHGWPGGVEALPRQRQGARQVAKWMQKVLCEQLNLFACNAARERPEGCFAKWVAEECYELGHTAQIFGHETRGHTTWNPKARFYWSTVRGVTTENLFDPEQDPWSERAAFRKRLKEDQKYRLLLPFIFDSEDEEEEI